MASALLPADAGKVKPEVDGASKRVPSSFRNWIQNDGEFTAERGRYHLYVSYACPWATRALIMRKLKGLEDIVSVTVLSPRAGELGWSFANAQPFRAAENDPLYNAKHIREFYLKVDPNYSGRFTIPVLWDKKTHTIVNNESAEIMRMFNSAFDHLLSPEKASVDMYPERLREEIDAINAWVLPTVNSGVYRAGFATTQEVYEGAVYSLFESLDRLDKILAGKQYLVGDTLTEADIRLFVTMIRFDPVYVGHYKCNLRTIRNGYPAIHTWMRNLYWNNDAFKSTTDFEHIRNHYYWSEIKVNPTRVIAVGPIPDIEPL